MSSKCDILHFIIKFGLGIFVLVLIFNLLSKEGNVINNVSLIDVDVVSYDSEFLSLKIEPSSLQSKCAISKFPVSDVSSLEFINMDNGVCNVDIDYGSYYVYFKNGDGVVSNPRFVSDYVVYADIEEKYYLPILGTIDLDSLIKTIGNASYSFEYDSNVVSIDDGILTGISNGNFNLKIIFENEVVKESSIYVVDGIVARPKMFNSKKSYLACHAYDKDKADLLDEILEYRVANVGYGTRAGVVEAARFLTLEFPYRIAYFYENGRVSRTGVNLADGEGRYYHKGLYLHESKFADIKYTFSGKAIWGCGLLNNEPNQPDYPRNKKLPNGLDCSGFVTWVILNGGFDVGDIGAGESASPNQLTDVGKYTPLTRSLVNSGKIKVGDLFNFWGHIAILIGEDENNYYIAESLNTYFGVIVKTYSKNRVMDTFTHVVLMEDYYKEDGNLTKMWY